MRKQPVVSCWLGVRGFKERSRQGPSCPFLLLSPRWPRWPRWPGRTLGWGGAEETPVELPQGGAAGGGAQNGKRARKSGISLWHWSEVELNYWLSVLAVFLNAACASSGEKRTGDL